MKLGRISVALFLSAMLSACGKVGMSSPQSEPNNSRTDTGLPGPAVGNVSYFRIASTTPDQVGRSSTLKFQNGDCSLDGFYDFPDWIFGDSDLDNLTNTKLDVGSCARLAMADEIKAVGACSPTSVVLTDSQRSSLNIDPDTMALLNGISPGSQGFSAADLTSSVKTIDLDQDCVCSLTMTPALGTGLTLSATVPPPLDLCSQAFAQYSPANISAAQSAILAKFGIP